MVREIRAVHVVNGRLGAGAQFQNARFGSIYRWPVAWSKSGAGKPAALEADARSGYHDRNGTKFWIITEADRSATTVLLPEDY